MEPAFQHKLPQGPFQEQVSLYSLGMCITHVRNSAGMLALLRSWTCVCVGSNMRRNHSDGNRALVKNTSIFWLSIKLT